MYKVSVLVITYNHADYIKQTLDGILAQETDFDFEIVVGDELEIYEIKTVSKKL